MCPKDLESTETELNTHPELTPETVSCRGCSKDILLLLIGNKPIITGQEFIYECKCPFCGDKSWKKTTQNQIKIAAAEGVYISNYLMNENSIEILTEKI